jgi:iron complex outermembrane receptor protein
MFERTRLCRGLMLAFGGGLALSVLPTMAQQQLERVEITGSSIKRVESETALPVTIITREQIERSGATKVEDLLARVSAGNAMQSDTTQGAGYATSNANLRGVGATSTLVLLNGRRLANHPFGNIGGTVAVDLNSIPFAAIERIEVLRDGASAVYGTDAVGGVINFITRRDYKNGELTLRYGNTQKDIGGKEDGLSIAYGMGDLATDRYNLLVTANYQANTRLRAVDQKLYLRGLEEIPGSDPPTSGRAYPGRLVDFGISPGAYVSNGSFTDPAFAPCDPVNTIVQDAGPAPNGTDHLLRCRFIYPATLDNLPDQHKADVYSRLTFALDPNTTLFGEASFARNHNIGRIAPVPIDQGAGHINPATGEGPHFLFPVSSPYFPTALLTQLGFTGPFDTQGNGFTEIGMRAVPVGNRVNDNTNDQMRFVGGVQGSMSGWDYESGLTYSRAKGSLNYYGYISEPRFLAALATGLINPFGPMDQAGNDLLRTTLLEGPMRRSTSTTTEIDAKASRELMAMGGGNMAMAVGVDLRREQANDKPVNDEYRQGLHIGGEGSVPETNASRNVFAVFSELSLPFAKGWEGTLAARYDKYSDFGSTFNPRASLRWQPDRSVLLRTSAGTGFRAPSLWDVNSPPSFSNTANSLVDPSCPPPPVSTPGDPRCETQFTTRSTSSPNLKPEKSRQFSAGIVLEPVKWLSTSLDYWYISKKDQIDTISGDALLTDPALLAAHGDRIHRDSQGFIAFIDTPVENLGGLRTSGWDLDVKGSWLVEGVGKFGAQLTGTYITRWERQNGIGAAYVSYLGTAGDGGTVQPKPRWQHVIAFDYATGPWGASLENTFVKGWTESADLVDANIGVHTEHKVKDTVRWNLAGTYTGVKNLKLRLGIRNLFNTEPPFTAVSSYGSHAAGYAASFADPRGRFYYATLSYQFK